MMKYDIFISHKHTDENGNLTDDFRIAKSLYDVLVAKGYSVFLSSSSLEKIGSSRYKADIDDALDNSDLMIVVLTKAKYALSQWVQYEWDSFYNDYLSGSRKAANLFTVTAGVNIHDLPRTLRNVQNFDYCGGIEPICNYIENAVPVTQHADSEKPRKTDEHKREIEIISGKQITAEDIRQALALDDLVYEPIYIFKLETCLEWFKVNPDIYVMARDTASKKIIAYVNVAPITDECYERMKRGDFIDTEISADMVLGYDMPYPYSIYFSSIVIHPDYQNTSVFMDLFNAVIKKFITLGEHEVYIKRMIADAVTANGEKFCRLFGMNKVKSSTHNSTLYEITMIPPQFKVLSKMAKALYDYYMEKYKEAPYLFDSDNG